MELTKEDAVYVLTLTNGANANTINADVIGEYSKILDELEATTENSALVVTSSDPKFWCNGIDLKWLLTRPPDYYPEFALLAEKDRKRYVSIKHGLRKHLLKFIPSDHTS